MDPSNTKLICSMCPPDTTAHLSLNLSGLLKHVKLFHAHQPGFKFTCGINGCLRSFTNFRTFQDHVSALHRHQLNPTNITAVVDDTCSGDSSGVDGDDSASCVDDLADHALLRSCRPDMSQRSAALFLMAIKEKNQLSQAAIQGIIEGVTILQQQQLDKLHTQVCERLGEAGVVASSVPGLDALFMEEGENGHLFAGLETQHQQLKYIKTHFNLIVSTQS